MLLKITGKLFKVLCLSAQTLDAEYNGVLRRYMQRKTWTYLLMGTTNDIVRVRPNIRLGCGMANHDSASYAACLTINRDSAGNVVTHLVRLIKP